MRRTFAVVLAAGVLALLPIQPAAAHGRGIELTVAGDGAAGVTVLARYADGHPVDDQPLRLVLTASGEGGRSTGAVQLSPAPEGRGFYASGAVLTPGRWTVVVTAPAPSPARATVTVHARADQTPVPPVTAGPKPAAGGAGAERGGRWVWWVIGLALGGSVIVGGLVLASRRR